MKTKYKFLFILAVASMMACLMIPASADSFEGSNDGDYLFLDIDGDKGIANMRIDGNITFIQGEIKYYKNGNFQIKAIQNRVILLGTFLSDESLRIIIIDRNERKEIILEIQKLATEYIIPVKEEHVGMGDMRAEEQLRLEEEKKKQEKEVNKVVIPRAEYIQSDQEIAILIESMGRVSINAFFDFDIRLVDPKINQLYNYYESTGYINGVQINATVRDGDGKILNTFSGNTTNNGHYSPESATYFADNTNIRNAFTVEILAIKYFDDLATFTTTTLLKEFFVFVPSSSRASSIDCLEDYIKYHDGSCDVSLV